MPAARKRRFERLQVAARDILVGDDGGDRAACSSGADARAGFGQQAVADGDVIAAVAQRDVTVAVGAAVQLSSWSSRSQSGPVAPAP